MTKYSEWLHYYQHNGWQPSQLPFRDRPSLSASERELIAKSIQQFQLGEGSSGEGLIRRARQFACQGNLARLPDCIELFIKEEQRHSAVLGEFLDQEQIPRLRQHWVDRLFRKIRNLAGFELMLSVLVTAEYIAVPYYTALHDATE